MKLQHSIRTTVLAGLAVMAIPFTTAQAALTFDQWTVGGTTAGQIDGCPSGIATDCTTLVTGDGFLQQEYTDPTTSQVYIHTIITDAGAVGDPTAGNLTYVDESFVRSAGTTTGIVGKQVITDNSTAGFTFTSGSELYTGWGGGATIKPAGKANLNITQGFTDTGVSGVYGDEFSSNFDLKVNLADATYAAAHSGVAVGDQIGKSMSIGQVVEMGDGSNANTSDIQRFIVEQRAGDLQTQSSPAGGFTLGSTSFDSGTSAAINGTAGSAATGITGGAATWAAGDDVMLVWLGQEVSAQTPGSSGGLSIFGYESVTVVGGTDPTSGTATGTANQFASTFSTSTPGVDTTVVDSSKPFNWDEATFSAGTTPTLPAPAVNTGTSTSPVYVDSGACEVSGSTANCLN